MNDANFGRRMRIQWHHYNSFDLIIFGNPDNTSSQLLRNAYGGSTVEYWYKITSELTIL